MYLSMSLWFAKEDYPGSATWCRTHSDEERAHALKLFDHLTTRKVAAKIQTVDLHEWISEFKDPTDIWKQALKQRNNSSLEFFAILKAAREEDDFVTDNFLQWFVKEKLEEENALGLILSDAERVIETKGLYYEVDRHLPRL